MLSHYHLLYADWIAAAYDFFLYEWKQNPTNAGSFTMHRFAFIDKINLLKKTKQIMKSKTHFFNAGQCKFITSNVLKLLAKLVAQR